MAEKTGRKQVLGRLRRPVRVKGGQFAPGVSGNKAGRPVGARNRATILAEAMLDGEVEALVGQLVAMARAGDRVALRLCVERLLPARRSRAVEVALPAIRKAADLVKASAAVIAAVSGGTLAMDEGRAFMALLDGQRRTLELADFEARLEALEAASSADPVELARLRAALQRRDEA